MADSFTEKLVKLMEDTPASKEIAAFEDGKQQNTVLQLNRTKARLQLQQIDLDRCRALLSVNMDLYRSVAVAPIINTSTALLANSSYTLDVLLRFPLAFEDLSQLVQEVMDAQRRFNVDPSPTLTNFRKLVLMSENIPNNAITRAEIKQVDL